MVKQKLPKEFPFFGLLHHVVGSNWGRNRTIQCLGKEWLVQLTVSIGKEGLECNQTAAYQLFATESDAVMKECEDTLSKYYLSQVELPHIRNLTHLIEHVSPIGVHFPRGRPHPTWGLLFDSTDDERGIAIEVVGNKIVRVGTQHLVL